MRSYLTFHFNGLLLDPPKKQVQESTSELSFLPSSSWIKREPTHNPMKLVIWINNVRSEHKISSQIQVADTDPYLFEVQVCIQLIDPSTKSLLSTEIQVVAEIKYKFTRRINSKLNYNVAKSLGSYLDHTQMECATAGFLIPVANEILAESPLILLEFDEYSRYPLHISNYFHEYNLNQVLIASNQNQEFVSILKIHSIVSNSYTTNKSTQPYLYIYYYSVIYPMAKYSKQLDNYLKRISSQTENINSEDETDLQQIDEVSTSDEKSDPTFEEEQIGFISANQPDLITLN